MFIAVPFESQPSQRKMPWATVLLILVCCVAHWGFQSGDFMGQGLAASVDANSFTGRFAYQLASDGNPLTWISAPFLHADWFQLLSSMLLVLLFGVALELAMGPAFLLVSYTLCGMAGAVLASLALGGSNGMVMGATGGAAGLAIMYAIHFQLRRIRFAFWRGTRIWLVRWPAWVVLPALPVVLIAQALLSARPTLIGLMAMGGLIVGAVLVVTRLQLQVRFPLPSALPPILDTQPATLPMHLEEMKERAQELGDKLEDMPRATLAWRAVARHSREDAKVLQAWFECAQHAPHSDDFHTAARYIFKLPDTKPHQLLKHDVWQTYTKFARPATRMSDDTRHALARTFIGLGELGSAERICTSLAKYRDHPMWPGTLAMLVNGLARSGQMDQARHWLPLLQRDAPEERVTQWLSLMN